MFDNFQKSLDRELGPVGEGSGRPPARDPWLRDWPLLLGLVLSAALIAASTMLGSSQARPAGAAPSKAATAAGSAVPGEVVDVGDSDALAEPAPVETTGKPSARKRAAKKSHGSSSSSSASPEPSAQAGAAPAAGQGAASGGSSGGSSSPPRGTKRSGGSAPPSGPAKPGRIVNVTGTSATFTNGPVSYAFSAPTHTPVVGKRWRLSIAGQRSGAPLTGTVKIDILHEGTVVGHAAAGTLKGGRFAHDFDWPERSAGYPLTVKTTVVGGGFQQSFLFNVKIKSAG